MKQDLISKLKAFVADHKGNVAIIFAFAAIPIFIGIAATVDYSRAAKVRGELAAIADSAVLTGTTPAMLTQSTATARTAVQNMFAAQAQTIRGQTYDATQLTVNVADDQQPNYIKRTVQLNYNASVPNVFGALLSRSQTSFPIQSTAATSNAPNIDFYMLVDNSPSMELPATTQGVSDMITKTGCAFACHENDVADSENTVHYKGWGTIDSYTFAKNSGIALRIDNVRDAVSQVATTAQSTMAYNGATYRMAVYGFNHDFATIQSLLATNSTNVSTIQASVATLTPPLMAKNNCLADYSDAARTKPQNYVYPTATGKTTVSLNGAAANTSGNCFKSGNAGINYSLYNNDAMTDFSYAMARVNSVIPTPGNGGAQSGDTPQGVLMIVTDGVVDAAVYSSSDCGGGNTVSISNTYGSFKRCHAPIDPSVCTTIKNKGVRIAVLYTTYQPVESDSWYVGHVKPFISQVASNLQSCASSPSLFHEVTTNGDIRAALADLFQKAVTTAPRLTH
ncbi:pilus assembly protein [Rhodoblastus acidophilus]|uniref:Pilus assembly protein n=1 Tax=Rhodoblastus acidophilus TaxID=1074 RepID=A0A6N8DMK1_RHOAC|nr:TadE/TadG family type IV pilus assembly protein [Rhodoblastus acidophilus]MCW2273107.1 Flp pilus assembly protein TadG [Rhodoblastus acidophilus]MTV30004.1 pilus assembly protein [Rhodoblastus acidophilus]